MSTITSAKWANRSIVIHRTSRELARGHPIPDAHVTAVGSITLLVSGREYSQPDSIRPRRFAERTSATARSRGNKAHGPASRDALADGPRGCLRRHRHEPSLCLPGMLQPGVWLGAHGVDRIRAAIIDRLVADLDRQHQVHRVHHASG